MVITVRAECNIARLGRRFLAVIVSKGMLSGRVMVLLYSMRRSEQVDQRSLAATGVD